MELGIFELPIAIQVGLGGGFIAYMLASAGLRRGHTPLDVFMRSLAFGLPGMLTFTYETFSTTSAINAVLSVILSVAIGGIWRAFLAEWVIGFVKAARIHGDDFQVSAWDRMIQDRRFEVTQVKVCLKSGTELLLVDGEKYIGTLCNGLLVGSDGAIAMVVDRETRKGVSRDRRDIQVEEWGTRLTYVPAAEIERVEFRCVD